MRVLVIEPNARIGALVCGQLRQLGYEAEDVRNGVEGVSRSHNAMGIGFAGDFQIPEMDAYALRLQKSVDTIVGQSEEITAEIDSILGPEGAAE